MRQKSPKNPAFSLKNALFPLHLPYLSRAFLQRLGQTSTQFIHTKMKTGSDLQAVRYLYDILAAGIAAQNNCMSQPFDRYYRPPVMPVSTQPEKSASPIRRMQHKLVRDKIPTLLKNKRNSLSVYHFIRRKLPACVKPSVSTAYGRLSKQPIF